MATRDASVTKRHVSQLQSSTELHQPSPESKPARFKKEKPNQEDKHSVAVLFARELEEGLGVDIVDFDHDGFIYMEVF